MSLLTTPGGCDPQLVVDGLLARLRLRRFAHMQHPPVLPPEDRRHPLLPRQPRP